jgi:rare lipoprotein A
VPDAVARAEPLNPRANRPYVVFGQSYVPLTELQPFRERGTATWYGRRYHGRRTSNGEPYDMYAMTAAHPRLPLPSYARVTNLANSRTVIVRVNDRGPFLHGRVIDLSWTAATRLGFANRGTAEVEVELITEFDEPAGTRTAAAGSSAGSQSASAGAPPGTRTGAASGAAAALVRTGPASSAATGIARTGPASGPVPGLTLTALATSDPPERPAAAEPAAAAVTLENNGLPPLQREVLVSDDDSARAPAPRALSSGPTSASPTSASPTNAGTGPTNASTNTAATSPGVFLQLGAFQSRANAETARAQYLKSLGWTADKLSVRSDGRLHRLVAGPYTDRREAQEFTERIRATTGVQALPVSR